MSASDDFNSYANASTLAGQGNWANMISGQIDKVVNPSGDGRAVGASGSPQNINFYNSGTWADNQWSASTAYASGGQDVVVAVRCSSGSGGNCYYATRTTAFGGYLLWGKFNSGSDSAIGNTPAGTLGAGDVLRLEVTGTGSSTRLKVIFNGVTKASNIDPGGTYISSGYPGMGGGAGAGTSTTSGVTYWQASDI